MGPAGLEASEPLPPDHRVSFLRLLQAVPNRESRPIQNTPAPCPYRTQCVESPHVRNLQGTTRKQSNQDQKLLAKTWGNFPFLRAW